MNRESGFVKQSDSEISRSELLELLILLNMALASWKVGLLFARHDFPQDSLSIN